MGVDPAAVGLSAVVSCASVIHEDWRVQPKRYDDTWVERARLWGAIVGDPSILKSPVVAACTRPIEQLETAARDRHSDAMRAYRTELAAWKKAEVPTGPMPVPPRLDRYLVESTTVEALSEVLREDEDAKHHAPLGRVLLRQDEFAEWLATFDRYRSGGRGGADRGAYLRLYNGGRHTVDRVTRGSFRCRTGQHASWVASSQNQSVGSLGRPTMRPAPAFCLLRANRQGSRSGSPPQCHGDRTIQTLIQH